MLKDLRKQWRPEWMPSRKMQEWLQYRLSANWQRAQRELHRAVVTGQVRARLNGRLLGPEWLKQIDRMIFDDTNPVQLPPDIELSVKDAERVWPR
jgi:hypothetical protein